VEDAEKLEKVLQKLANRVKAVAYSRLAEAAATSGHDEAIDAKL
jgi:hypothetical protein